MLNDNRIQGAFRREHWRIPYLKPQDVPRLSDLLTMDWEQLDDAQRFQVNHATAKMFAMYLQEQGKLGDVLDAYKGLDLFELDDDTRVVERAFGVGIAQLGKQYLAWLSSKLGWSSNAPSD